jgi:hypothetical protein
MERDLLINLGVDGVIIKTGVKEIGWLGLK